MTKAGAIHQFMGGFGIPAYPTSNVPDDVVFPYLTYELITGAWGDAPVGITAELWYYTTSEKQPNDKVNEISAALMKGGKVLRCDEGLVWLKRGEPWCMNLKDEADPTIKRRKLNIAAEYPTFY